MMHTPLIVALRRPPVADWVVRLFGLAVLCLAGLSVVWLRARVVAHHGAEFGPDYLAAIVGFLGATTGSAMLALGRHLFDPVQVSERWRRFSLREHDQFGGRS